MPRTMVTRTEVFKLEELTSSQRQSAYEKWQQGNDFWTEYMYEDFVRVAEILGIEIDTRPYKTMGGQQCSEPAIYWSGFSCQGDGACFEGSYRYSKGSVKAIKEYAPQDTVLHEIALYLQAIQKPFLYQLRAKVKHRGHYYHSNCTDVEVFHDEDSYRDIGDAEGEITKQLRRFMDWMYRQLEKEYDYQQSEEAFKDYCESNDAEFDEDGNQV